MNSPRTAIRFAAAAVFIVAASFIPRRVYAWDTYTSPRNADVSAAGANVVVIDAAAGSLRVEGRTGIDQVRVRGTAKASDKRWLDDIKLFLFAMPVLGFFTNGVFALFTIWLPELFASQSRGAGIGFAFSLGRILAAAGPMMIGALAAHTGSYPVAITLVSMIYLPGIFFVMMCRETTGKALPA